MTKTMPGTANVDRQISKLGLNTVSFLTRFSENGSTNSLILSRTKLRGNIVSKDCLSHSQVYVTGVSKSKDCLSLSQVYVTGVSKSKDCLSHSQVYVS